MSPQDRSERDRRLDEVVTAYLKDIELGRATNQADWLARYPDLADDLAVFFAAQEQVGRLAAPLRVPAAGSDAATLAPGEPAPADQTLGTVRYFGDYELLEEIARGGMGVVYKARQVTLQRLVAVKMILAGELANQSDVERFYTEARAAAKLHHPNIVAIHEVGQHQRQHYFSMDYVAGESLANRIARGPLPAREAAALVKKVAEAVAFAHVEGVIHRDLKPANVLLDAQGEPHVTDFGLAKRVQSEPGAEAPGGLTETGQVLGTPSYMPPEQASGNTKEIGPRSDVYSLGAVLYCAFTGRPPFQAAGTLDTLLQVLDRDPVPPRALNPAVPRDLETICLKCLEKDPRRRYASAQELADELRRFLDGEPIRARPAGRVEKAMKWVRRRPAVASLLATIILVTLAGIAGITWAWRMALDERDNTRAQEKLVREERDNTRAQEKLVRQELLRAEGLLYSSQIAQAQLLWQEGNVLAAHQVLDDCRRDLRGWEHDYLWALFNNNQQTFRGHTAKVNGVAFSPDGKRIVSGSQDGNVKVWDLATGQAVLTREGTTVSGRNYSANVLCVAISPDGRRIVSGNFHGEVEVWDAATGRHALSLKGHAGLVYTVAFSHDGKQIVTGSSDGFHGAPDSTMRVWDAATGRSTLTVKQRLGFSSAAFSPDGKHIVSGSHERMVMWDAATGKDTQHLKGQTDGVTKVAFSRDGKRIVVGCPKGTVRVWDTATGKQTFTVRGHTGEVGGVAFSPDGKRIASGSGDRTVKVWDAENGDNLFTFKGHAAGALSVAFSPDGQFIASGSGDTTVKVWHAARSQDTPTFHGHTNDITSVAFSPDGKHIASGSIDKTVKIWDAATVKATFTFEGHVFTPEGHGDWVQSVAYSPDGKHIVSGGDRTVKVWDAASGKEIFTFKGHSTVRSLAFSPDGKRILGCAPDKNVDVKVWDVATGKETFTFEGYCAAYSPDGKHIVSGGFGGLAIGAEGPTIDPPVKIRDAATGQVLRGGECADHTLWVRSVAFSPDSRHVVGGCGDKTLKVWDVTTGEHALTLKGHTDAVNSVAYSPDGKRIVSGSEDHTVRVWDAATGQNTLTLKEHTKEVTGVAFSPDGKRIASGSRDRTVKVWDASSSQKKP